LLDSTKLTTHVLNELEKGGVKPQKLIQQERQKESQD